MQMDPQITFEGIEALDTARALILKEIHRLESHNKHITGCRVSVIAPSDKHHHGAGFEIHIRVTIPPHREIVVNHAPPGDRRHEHAESAIKDAFAAAMRQIDDMAA
ncbi:MAG: RNA polymerase subunit sigma-54 [Bradyrhizobiaceae bacterium]|nr:MAG: RNA polymerase subunit sigma-54 [Bradyrhizobiaceae bacterium]